MLYRLPSNFKEKVFNSLGLNVISCFIIALVVLSCSGEDDTQDQPNLYDGEYEGVFYFENEQLASWKIQIEDNQISPLPTSASDDVLISGFVTKNGEISGSTDMGYSISGVIDGEEIHGTWELESYNGVFSGYKTSSSKDNEEEGEEEEEEEKEEEEEEEENDYPELDADFSLRVEGPLGTTGGYYDPVSIEFSTSNDHYQNYSPAPQFSWSYFIDPRNIPDEDLENIIDSKFTEFSDKVTYKGYSFTREVELEPFYTTTYVYFRLAITKPNGDVVVKTKKAAFPMVRATGYFKVDGTTYSLDQEVISELVWGNDRVVFRNINNRRDDIPYFTWIQIPSSDKTVGDHLYIAISTTLPTGQLLSFHQMDDDNGCNEGCYEKLGFFVYYGNYATFDDPSGAYSSGSVSVVQGNEHPDIQNAIELKMTLRGNYGRNEDDEITAELVLFNVIRAEWNEY